MTSSSRWSGFFPNLRHTDRLPTSDSEVCYKPKLGSTPHWAPRSFAFGEIFLRPFWLPDLRRNSRPHKGKGVFNTSLKNTFSLFIMFISRRKVVVGHFFWYPEVRMVAKRSSEDKRARIQVRCDAQFELIIYLVIWSASFLQMDQWRRKVIEMDNAHMKIWSNFETG